MLDKKERDVNNRIALNSIMALTCVLLLASIFFISINTYREIISDRYEQTVDKAYQNIEQIVLIVDDLFIVNPDTRRARLVVYTKNNKTSFATVTVVYDKYASNQTSLVPNYTNIPITGSTEYYTSFLKGLCTLIKTEDSGVLDIRKQQDEVFVLSVPIHAPFLIGEIGYAFDKKHPMTKTKKEYCDI